MQVTVKRSLWLCDATALPGIDLENPSMSYPLFMYPSGYDAGSTEWLRMGEVECKVTWSYDQEALTQQAVAGLKEKIAEVEQEAFEKVQMLKKAINNLLALPAPEVISDAEVKVKAPDHYDDISF